MEKCLDKNGDKVSLKCYLESRIDAVEKFTDERFQQSEKALVLQAEKNEQHFGILNNENIRLANFENKMVSREVYELHHGELMDKIEKLEKDYAKFWITITLYSLAVGSMIVLILYHISK